MPWQLLFTFLPLLSMALGCGTTGAPQPPSLKLPQPPTDLTASRAGDVVSLRWTMPDHDTDRVHLQGEQLAVLCRAEGAKAPVPPPEPAAGRSCHQVAALRLAPGKPAFYADTLPPALATGSPALLRYMVLLENQHEHAAGPSNQALAASGAAPPQIRDLAVQTEQRGLLLRWRAEPALLGSDASRQDRGLTASDVATVSPVSTVQLHRTRLSSPGERTTSSRQETAAGVPQPVEQTLEVRDPGGSLDHAIDHDAELNRTYRYSAERVYHLVLDGHAVVLSGAPSDPVTVVARDTFPPAVPGGLAAVADPAGGAIDLSWTADADRDLAGYFVYRRAPGLASESTRVSGPAPLVNAAWRDLAVDRGRRYAYSVSAVDMSGNESARSGEQEETLPIDSADQPQERSTDPKPAAGRLARKPHL